MFTVEALPAGAPDAWVLTPSGRYAHADGYVSDMLTEAGLDVVEVRRGALRTEAGIPVDGLVVSTLAVRPGAP